MRSERHLHNPLTRLAKRYNPAGMLLPRDPGAMGSFMDAGCIFKACSLTNTSRAGGPSWTTGEWAVTGLVIIHYTHALELAEAKAGEEKSLLGEGRKVSLDECWELFQMHRTVCKADSRSGGVAGRTHGSPAAERANTHSEQE